MRRQMIPTLMILVLLGASLPAAPEEGYDPLRIISAQIAKPNIFILQDVTGSMRWNQFGDNKTTSPNPDQPIAADQRGNYPTATWAMGKSSCSATAPTKCKTWTYTLTVTQQVPSRMCMLKNALGNSVTITPAYLKPADAAYPLKGTFPSAWSSAKDTANKACTGTVTGPTYTFTNTYPNTTWSWKWSVTYSGGTNNYCGDPGIPFTGVQTIGANAAAPKYGTYPTQTPPQDLLGKTKDSVNWGLITYSGSNCPGTFTNNFVDVNDNGDVTAIQTKMQLSSLSGGGGLSASGATCTRDALNYTKVKLQAAFDNDEKYQCGRTYGVILVTDGESNQCNPDASHNNTWSTCVQNNTEPNWANFPPGKSEYLWKSTFSHGGSGSYRTPVRTWVIGVADDVAPCELNWTAYMGRTDASSPNGDAGFAITWPTTTTPRPTDTYLPQADGDRSRFQIPHNGGNYAYFATSAQALKEAFEQIIAGLGPGDYTTSQPIVSSSTGNAGYVTLLASSEYPGWKGHVYADALAANKNCDLNICTNANPTCDDCVCATCPGNVAPPGLWDAGAKLALRDASTRKIYTWNSSMDLVEVTTANAAILNGLCGSCGINAAVVDYIRGVGRTWKLGAVLNSTPTIVAGPIQWKSDQVPSHTTFEGDYGARHPLVYAGASDGMLHAFDAVDGYEVFALLTPDNLAEQKTLYDNYIDNPSQNPTGEPVFVANHIWGLANSPRVQDVYFGSPDTEYKTVLFVTQGPSSRNVAAIDITHPYPGRTGVLKPDRSTHDYAADKNYSATDPIGVIWTKNSTNYPELGFTWSMPAVASTTISTSAPDFEANIGSGWNPLSTLASPTPRPTPRLYALDATDGTANRTVTLTNPAAPVAIVGNQAFADTVMFKYDARIFTEGTAQDVAIQADLNGQLWFLPRPSGSSATAVFNASTYASQAQPIYYSPAVAGFKEKMCLAFASGSYFEKAPAVNGSHAAPVESTFLARLYLIAKGQDASSPAASGIWSQTITSLSNTLTGTLSDNATVVSPALMLVPNSDSGFAIALFPVYDPNSGDCAGTSYVIKIVFDPTDLSSAAVTVNLIGSGAISGFAVAGDTIIVAKSGVGAGARATAPVVPGVTVGGSENGMKPIWWRELQ